MTWHVDAQLLAAYAAGGLDLGRAASVETHLAGCGDCQRAAAAHVADERIDGIWTAVADDIDAPRPGPAERLLRHVGFDDPSARLVAATPQLRGAWASAVGLLLLLAALASSSAGGPRLGFIALAPLLPLGAVAAAFSTRLDPMAELAASTPMPSHHVLFARGIASLAPTVVVAGLAAAVAPAGVVTVAWLLPGLALCALAVALATWVDPVDAAVAMGGTWCAGVIAFELAARRRSAGAGAGAVDALASRPGQALAAAVVVAALTVVVTRRQRFDLRRS